MEERDVEEMFEYTVKDDETSLQSGEDMATTNSRTEEMFELDQSEQEQKEAQSVAVSASNPQPAAMIPCLKGTMTYVGGVVYCKGRWAMTEQAHDNIQNTSEFEFKLVTPDEMGSHFPVNGLYQGWFNVKQLPPAKGSIKVDDKEMKMTFTLSSDGTYVVIGEGHNKFGSFRLRGTLQEDGTVVMYREYYHINPTPVTVIPTSRRGKSLGGEKKEKQVKKEDAFSPREGGRVRKQSVFLKEFHDPLARSKSNEVLELVAAPPMEPTPRTSMPRSSSDRAPRLNSSMKRCADLLKDISKHPQAVWFLEPVDPIALNIPDYPRIIKNPMDFSTIRSNIENAVYDNVHAFAEHVRLVFRNAIQFNASPDNAVNIAARDLSSRFEEKFRSLLRQIDPEEYIPDARPLQRAQSLGSNASKRGRNTKDSSGRYSQGGLGPRAHSGVFLPPAAMDSSAQTILELRRAMQAMQDELKMLRASFKEREVMHRVMETKEAAMNPMCFEDKKALINKINALPVDKMDRVLEIIRESRSLPAGHDHEEIEVPLDSLDSLTLRKLQQFVEETEAKQKKRSLSSGSNLNAAGGSLVNGSKKAKRSRQSVTTASSGTTLGEQDPADLLFEDDDFLFAPESLEDAHRSDTQNGYTLHHHHVDSAKDHLPDDEDENMWNAAADELRSKRPDIDSYG